MTARVGIEAGTARGWHRFLGTHGQAVSVEGLGRSGDGAEVLRRQGISKEAVMAAAERTLRRVTRIPDRTPPTT